MRLAVIVLAYHMPGQLRMLMQRLRHPQIRVYLHIDSRKPMAPFQDALEGVADHITVLPRHPSVWGSAECVDAILAGMRAGVVDRCDYFALISGQDFPLRSLDEIIAFYEAAGDTSYIAHWPLSASLHRFAGRDRTDFYAYTVRGRREICIPRGEDAGRYGLRGWALNHALRAYTAFKPDRSFPGYARPFAGSTWWNLSRTAVANVEAFLDAHPDYRGYHQHTWVPEEVFFQSILVGTSFAQTHPVVNDDLRFSEWDGMNARTLSAADMPAMLASNKLFARKFDFARYPEAIPALARARMS